MKGIKFQRESSTKQTKFSLSLSPDGPEKTNLDILARKSGAMGKFRRNEMFDTRKPGRMLEKGGALLGAGVLIMATSGVSFPAAVTCSAIVIATTGVARAKAAVNDNVIHQEARAAFRRSKSVRKLENIVFPRRKASMGKNIKKYRTFAPEISDPRPTVPAPESSEVELRHASGDIGANTEEAMAANIDVEAYSVVHSEPSILSVPVLGTILNTVDDIAFRAERLSDQFSYRLITIIGVKHSSSSWVLLESFRRKS
ncbi:unnamed protein product [Agarophyton chilense]